MGEINFASYWQSMDWTHFVSPLVLKQIFVPSKIQFELFNLKSQLLVEGQHNCPDLVCISSLRSHFSTSRDILQSHTIGFHRLRFPPKLNVVPSDSIR